MPQKKTDEAACYDLYAPYGVLLRPESKAKIDLHVALQIPPGYCGILTHRSGHNSEKSLWAYGTIDSDYRGTLKVTLFNTGLNEYRVKAEERIAQIRIVPVPETHMIEVEELDGTSRGEGGHGSTGLDG